MLIEFKVANYRSIRDEQTLSMVASKQLSELSGNLISCDHIPGLKGTKLLKGVALYGANASGKSNVLQAMNFLMDFVADSATKLQPGAFTGTQPFKLDPACMDQPSKFEITAVLNKVRILFGIELTRERVVSEYLVAYPNGRPQVWFERDWDASKKRYTWSKSNEHFKHDAALRGKTRENASFVSVAAQFAVKSAERLRTWMSKQHNLADIGKSSSDLATRMRIGGETDRVAVLRSMRTADLGITDLSVRKATLPDLSAMVARLVFRDGHQPPDFFVDQDLAPLEGKIYSAQLLHRDCDGKPVPLDFDDEESSGTKQYFALLGQMELARLENLLAIFDELESSLHPLLIAELLRAHFVGGDTPSTSQLIFTTHNPLLLDQTLLRRDQIWFTEKDERGATRLYPLTDFQPRKGESLVKGYLSGRYGGIPFIPEGLKL